MLWKRVLQIVVIYQLFLDGCGRGRNRVRRTQPPPIHIKAIEFQWLFVFLRIRPWLLPMLAVSVASVQYGKAHRMVGFVIFSRPSYLGTARCCAARRSAGPGAGHRRAWRRAANALGLPLLRIAPRQLMARQLGIPADTPSLRRPCGVSHHLLVSRVASGAGAYSALWNSGTYSYFSIFPSCKDLI